MANYSAIKAAVNAYIKRNGRKEITGQILNSVLNATIDSLGRYFQFAGGALPTDDPGTPDQNVCYLAGEPGLYTHFGNIRIENEEVALLFWDGEWTKQSILIGIREVTASVDNQVGTPSVDVSYSGGQLVLTFHNLKGNKGDTGNAAGFGTIGADITGGVGTPGVSVDSSGDNTSKNLMFHFTNLKGETGVTSVVATIDGTSGTPSCQVSLVNGVLNLAFSGLKGLKGDTGVSADYPITIYNGLDSDATDQALAAAQGKILDGKISQLRHDVDEKIGFEQSIPSHDNGYSLGTSGELLTNQYVTARGVSDFIPVTGGGQVFIKSGVFQGGNSNYSYAAFYSSNNEASFVSRLYEQPYSREITNKTVSVPATANYMRVVLMDNTIPAVFGGFSGSVKEYVDGQIAAVDSEIDAVNDRIDNLPISSPDGMMSDTSENAVQNKVIKSYVDGVTGYSEQLLPSAHDGYTLFRSDGTLFTNSYVSSRGVTDFVPVTPGGILNVKSGVYQGNNNAYCAIAFYSSNNEASFVSSINGTPNTEIRNASFTIPAGANYARFVLMDYSVPAVLGVGKTIKQMIDELSLRSIAKNIGKSIVVLGGSHTARENSEAAKNIWREKLGMDVYTAGVGSCGIIANITMYGWTYNGVSYYTRGGFNDGVNSRVWDDYGYLSDVTISAIGENIITLSDGNTYSRDTTKDYVNNAQTKISRLLLKSALDKDIYVIWLSTNDYKQTQPLGTFSDYTETDNYDTTKKWTDSSHRGTICGGFNSILKTIRDNNPTAEIYLFTSLRYFNDDAKGYNPFSSLVNGTGKNFYEYQQEVIKAAQAGGCAILDQFLLQGIGINNYTTFYESDALHLKVSGYAKIGFVQADFLANGK